MNLSKFIAVFEDFPLVVGLSKCEKRKVWVAKRLGIAGFTFSVKNLEVNPHPSLRVGHDEWSGS